MCKNWLIRYANRKVSLKNVCLVILHKMPENSNNNTYCIV